MTNGGAGEHLARIGSRALEPMRSHDTLPRSTLLAMAAAIPPNSNSKLDSEVRTAWRDRQLEPRDNSCAVLREAPLGCGAMTRTREGSEE